jgi:NRAMP (natural resistance-associated macrophage protein)-like metal ion transporter
MPEHVSLVLVLNGTDPHPTEDQASDNRSRRGLVRVLGLGVVTGAADDDCSAIGTYASAGAQFGTSLLWAAPVTFPMMFAVVYLSSKLGQVTGKGLFSSIKEHYSPWVLWPALVGVLAGNIIEAAADLGGMAAALGMFIHVPVPAIVIGVASSLFALQIFGSYELIRNVFRWLALALVAYIGSALLARPDPWEVVRGTFVPAIEFSRDFLSILVAIIGTTLSAYLYTWQSNVEVEEKIAHGQTKLAQRRGATEEELRQSRVDIVIGMLFSNLIMYFIVLSTAAFGMRGSLRKESRKQSFGFCARMPRSWRGTVAHVSLPAGAVLIQRL